MHIFDIKKRFYKARQILAVSLTTLCCCVLLVFLGRIAYADDQPALYFYSTDLNASRNVLLKSSFDKFLTKHPIGTEVFSFQPVSKPDNFVKKISDGGGLVLFMSYQHYKELTLSHANVIADYELAWQGLKEGSDTYKKILVGGGSVNNLKGSTVATVMTPSASRALLKEMLPASNRALITSINFLEVPKDLDSVMSVSFGMANYAMVRQDSFDILLRLYSDQFKSMRVLGYSKGLKRLVAVFKKDVPLDKKQGLNKAIKEMYSDHDGARALGVLGLDGWKHIQEDQPRNYAKKGERK